eukprot:CAMPEP_0172160104 /NCGR_PEP_ID=MMETSP1050-20130122/5372_1 /TAXON_ID=233186 /ORGANISM="Cryptomonas curvata, Strain CCAP979/52" /LENGTH=392 /DNA_ID=CAMNT_0012829829 /DNA_START=68 /DNA_END=1243 /DNA_ORIENTATION=-
MTAEHLIAESFNKNNPSFNANDQEKGAATALLSLAYHRAAVEQLPQNGLAVKERIDNRGRHWKDKVLQGCPPEPWKHTKDWAERRNAKENEFCELLRARSMAYTLPWRRSNSAHRSMGNTNKVLFMELLSHHLNGVANLSFVDEGACFLGIAHVVVRPEKRAIFDAGLIPSVDGRRRAEAGTHIKTLVKIWHTAGFVEHVLEGGGLAYVFDEATFDRMKAQAQRADEKRRKAAKPGSTGTSPTAAEASPCTNRQALLDRAGAAGRTVTAHSNPAAMLGRSTQALAGAGRIFEWGGASPAGSTPPGLVVSPLEQESCRKPPQQVPGTCVAASGVSAPAKIPAASASFSGQSSSAAMVLCNQGPPLPKGFAMLLDAAAGSSSSSAGEAKPAGRR